MDDIVNYLNAPNSPQVPLNGTRFQYVFTWNLNYCKWIDCGHTTIKINNRNKRYDLGSITNPLSCAWSTMESIFSNSFLGIKRMAFTFASTVTCHNSTTVLNIVFIVKTTTSSIAFTISCYTEYHTSIRWINI